MCQILPNSDLPTLFLKFSRKPYHILMLSNLVAEIEYYEHLKVKYDLKVMKD